MKANLFIILFVFLGIHCHSQSTITFNKTYNVGVDILFNVLETPTGYLTVSGGIDFSNGSSANVITQTNFNGDTIWRKLYGDSTEFHVNYGLVKTYDGNYVTGSYCQNVVTKKGYIELLKFDPNGNILWKKNTFPLAGFDYTGEYLIETSDSGFLITGQFTDSLLTIGDGFILKTDSVGNEQWHTILGGNNFENLLSSVELNDSCFLSLGWTRSYGAGDRDWYLVKTNRLGNFLWQKTFGSSNIDSPFGISLISDTTILLVGGGSINSNYVSWIVKIDTSGNIIDQVKFSTHPSSEFWWGKINNDQTIIVVGSERILGIDNGWIVKLDTSLNLVWSRSFKFGNDHAYFRNVEPTNDGGYITAGFAFDGASGGQDAWLVKLDSLGCDSVGCATYVTGIDAPFAIKQKGLSIYPNPAKEYITLSFSQPMFTACKVRVLDILGKEVFNQSIFIQKQFSIPVYSLLQGVYVVEIFHEGKKEYAKFVKE